MHLNPLPVPLPNKTQPVQTMYGNFNRQTNVQHIEKQKLYTVGFRYLELQGTL